MTRKGEGMRSIVVGGAVAAALALGCAAQAQGLLPKPRTTAPAAPAASAADPAPPDVDNADSVKAWIAANLDVRGWTPIFFDEMGISMAPEDVPLQPGGYTLQVRYEMWRLSKMPDGATYRSAMMTMKIDCAGSRVQETAMVIYDGNNLKGPPRTTAGPAAQKWVPLDPKDETAAVLLRGCGDKPAAGAAPSTDAPPRSQAEDDVFAWADSVKVEAGDDVMAYYDPSGLFFLRGKASKNASGVWLLPIRLEIFEPGADGARSAMMKVEVDCDGRRARIVENQGRTMHNLEGGTVRLPSRDWHGPGDGMEALQMDVLCAMAASSAEAR